MSAKTIGILGGGQLGRMSAQAASKLGIKVVIFTPEDNSPASQVADETIQADYTDQSALRDFADKVDVISYEFENIPVETIQFLKTLKPVYPDESLLDVSQDRIKEKSFLNSIGIPTARWAPTSSEEDLKTTLKEWNETQCIVKTTRFGYDGKGQSRYNIEIKENDAFQILKGELIAEELIDFSDEISTIIARDQQGNTQVYGPMLNEHKNHILDKTTLPAPIAQDIQDKAIKLTKKLAEEIDLIGVLTIEFFVTKDGQLLANEIAPRTHNSGHITIEACETSQFENHIRTVCGLPVGSTELIHAAEMINLIGQDIEKTKDYEDNPNAHIHTYGKTEIRAGRKMGHITLLKS